MRSTGAIAAVMALLLAGGPACVSGGGDGGAVGSDVSASFTPSGTDPDPGLVRLVSGGGSGGRVVVSVVLDGPVEQDLYAFAFDLVLSDASVARYVSGSARAGDVLTATSSGAPTVLASQQGNRVVFGISKVGPGRGDELSRSQGTIAHLTFEVMVPDVTEIRIDGSPQGRPPAALDDRGRTVDAVRFDRAAGRLAGT